MNRRSFLKNACVFTGLIWVPKIYAQPVTIGDPALASFKSASAASTVITSGLLSRWNFLEGSGSSTADTSGNGNSVALTASPTWGSVGSGPGGVTGGFMTFNGTTQFGTSGNYADNLAQFTLSCWFKVVNFTNPDQPMIAKLGTGGIGNGTGWVLGAELTNTVTYATKANPPYTGWDPDATSFASDGIWHHHLSLINNTGAQVTIAYYRDGTLITFSQDQNGTLAGGNISNSANVGLASDGTTGELFRGSIADVRVYNRLLTTTPTTGEVAQIYAKTG